MLFYAHQSGLGAPVDLATCAKAPTRCDPQRLAEILDGLECGCPPDATALNLLAQGMDAGDPIVGTNPFFGNAGVMRAFQANAPANPDTAIVLTIKAIDDLFTDVPAALKADVDDQRGFFAEAVRVIAQSIPKAQPDQQARGILKLKDMTGLKTLPNLARNAQIALGSITLPSPLPPAPLPSSAAPTASSVGFVFTPRMKTALLVTAAVAAVGGSAFLLWRVSRGPRMRPSYAVAARSRRR